MIALIAPLVMGYGLAQGVSADYTMNIAFDGFIPILGGQQGKAEVQLGFTVMGLDPILDLPQASSELTKADILFNGAKLPLGLENVQEYFPKTTISFTSLGSVKKTDAPNVKPPVKLPGLDVKRFPDISYLPIEFPSEGIEVGKPWSFKRSFADSDVTYTVTPTEITADKALFDVDMKQAYDTLESSSLEVVTNEEDAENKVHTDLAGKGKAVWDRKVNLFRTYSVSATAKSDVISIHDGEKSTRNLKINVDVKLVKPEAPK